MIKNRVRLAKIIREFRGRTVGVLGDHMLDEWLRGEVTRISPEAPVPVVLISDPDAAREFLAGGAGSVAASVAALGGRAILFGAIGKDDAGDQLLEVLRQRRIACGTLVREAGRVTPRKVRIVAHEHQLLRLDFEKPARISEQTTRSVVRHFLRWVRKLDALIISDHQEGTVTLEMCRQVVALARQRRVPVFVNPSAEQPEICHDATVVTANLREAELMAGVSLRNDREQELGGRRLLAQLGCENLLVTRGAEGMTLFESSGTVHEIPGAPRPLRAVAGAGDTVIAVLALACGAGATLQEAAQLANAAGSQAVPRIGTSEVSPEELFHVATHVNVAV